MRDSIPLPRVRKPASAKKPDFRRSMGLHPDFPLFPHGDPERPERLRWCKKVKGQLKYFGRVSTDPKGVKALEQWLRDKDDLIAGRVPRAKLGGLTVADLCNKFLTAKRHKVDAREITPRTWDNYKFTTDRIVAAFGKDRPVSDLGPQDFQLLRSDLAKTQGPLALLNYVQRVRTVFKFGLDNGLIERPIVFGSEFKGPNKKVLRLHKARQESEHGKKLFTAADVRKMIAAANPKLRAMIYLAVNCGFGNRDCGSLPLSALDLEGGWIDYARPKTGVNRRCPLWQETVAALSKVLGERKAPKNPEDAGLVFLTSAGESYVKHRSFDPIAKQFRDLVDRLGLHRHGRAFYTLRHTHRTAADESRDQPACDYIMGHGRDDMASVYRERIDDARLEKVVEHVRKWAFGKPVKAKQAKGKGKAVQHG
ncbi:MAG TPA: tyrosine-type recombinase/integrase [Pirellulaceae bacterium]|nr:tyrosine-type recombinase/integrase [Pirellulaceae bacterium]